MCHVLRRAPQYYTHLAGALLAAVGRRCWWSWPHAAATYGKSSLQHLRRSPAPALRASTLYHSARGRAKAILRKFDHCSIYLLIAGTYTHSRWSPCAGLGLDAVRPGLGLAALASRRNSSSAKARAGCRS